MTGIDYQRVFRALPGPAVLLSCDFTIVDVNDEFLDAVGRERADVVGRNAFAAFPTNIRASDDTGPDKLRASWETVVATGEIDKMDLIRYDIPVAGKPGEFEERYWSIVNSPVAGRGGQTELIIHRNTDATDTVRQVLKAQAMS